MDVKMKCCLGMLNEAVSVDYVGRVKQLKTLVAEHKLEDAQAVLDTQFDKNVMLSALLEKLKNKSVYKTLKRALNGTCESRLDHVKGLTSLCTHIIIECQHGRNEYRVLLYDVHKRIDQLMSEI